MFAIEINWGQCDTMRCCGGRRSYLVNLRVGALAFEGAAVVSGPAGVLTPATEVPLILPSPTLRTVCAAHPTVIHLH